MNLLSHAFEARDLLHEALGIKAAVVYCSATRYDSPSTIVVQAPLGPRPLGGRTALPPARITLNIQITLVPRSDLDFSEAEDDGDPHDPLPLCTATVTPGIDITRSFKLSRNNLLGWLGHAAATGHPLLAPDTPTTPHDLIEPWLLARLHDQVPFEWNIQNQYVHLTEPLIPQSTNPDDILRSSNSAWPRYKVFKDRRTTGSKPSWTYARLHPNGRDLDPHGPMAHNPADAREDAEHDALERGHFPASHVPYIALWQSRWDQYQSKHTAVLTCDQRITLLTNHGDHHSRISREHKTGDDPVFGPHPLGRDEALTEVRRLINIAIARIQPS